MSEQLSLKESGLVRIKENFPETMTHKIFETNSSFHVKYCTTGKVQFLSLKRFLLALTKLLFPKVHWQLDYHSMTFRHFLDIF